MMKGDTAASPERRKKMKKANLSKTAGGTGKVSKRDAILNRMSSGKKRPKSEPRIGKRALEAPPKDDTLSRRLFDVKCEDGVNPSEEKPKKVKVKNAKAKLTGQSMKTPSETASKWKVTDSKPVLQKPSKVAVSVTEIKSAKKVAREKSKSPQGHKVVDGSDDGDDDEVDFPVLKRKSLGINAEVSKETKLKTQGAKMDPDSPQKGTKKRKAGEKKVAEGMESVKGQTKKQNGSDEGEGRPKEEEKKKRRKRRGKKRKRSNSETEEPQAKKERQEEEFSVRCGNLPVGTREAELRMFLGEVDVFPKNINIKSRSRKKSGEKKTTVRYATVVCNSAEESSKLCALNGVSMPTTVGNNKDSRLLIHAITADRTNDSVMLFKRKLFIRNLHHKITEEELLEYFEKQNFNPTNVIFPRRGDAKKSTGTALVWLQSPSDADRALGFKNPSLRGQAFIIARANMPIQAVQEP